MQQSKKFRLIYGKGKYPFSLACVSSETHNLEAVFPRIYDTKRDSWCQAFLVETVETGNKNLCVTEATHVLQRK